MPVEKGDLPDFNLRRLFPWTELFRGFQLALDYRKLFLAAAAIVVLYIGWGALAWLFGLSGQPRPGEYTAEAYKAADEDIVANAEDRLRAQTRADLAFRKDRFLYEATEPYKIWPANLPRSRNPFLVINESVRNSPKDLLSNEVWREQAPWLLEPLIRFIHPITILLDSDAGFRARLFALLGIVWSIATWGIFGAAITRIAAVQFARRETISIREAVQFALAKFLSFFGAPLFPFIGVVVIGLIMVVVGFLLFSLLGFAFHVGDFLAALLWFLPLAGALIMAALLIGYVGWPLMYATISTEGSDSFDALSRSYAYVYQRPWHYVFYTVVSVLYGLVVVFFIIFVTSFFVYLAKLALGLTPGLSWRASTGYHTPEDPVSGLFIYAPLSYGWRDLLLGGQSADRLYDQMHWMQVGAAAVTGFWLHLVFLMMLGFAYSYFWSSSTIIYFLMRKSVDDTDMDEVYLEEDEEEPYPLSTPGGTAAAPGATTLPMVDAGKTAAAPEPPRVEPPKPEAAPPAAAPSAAAGESTPPGR